MNTTQMLLWLGAGGMALGLVAIIAVGRNLPDGRQHHVIVSAMVCAIAACAYFAMANGQGIHTFADAAGAARTVYFARYVDWLLTTPLLLIGLATVALPRIRSHLARERNALLGALVGADVLMVLTGLFGALSREAGVRWAWFAISCVFFGVVLYFIVGPLKTEAASRGPDHRELYNRLLGMLVVLWFVYPIVWAAGTEGLGEVGLSLEVAVFAVVDLLAKVGFGLLLVVGVAKIRAKDEEIVLG